MLRTVCKSKLHGATVTEANLQYTGSLTLDPLLMRAAELVPYQQVQVVNVNNGARFETYCIEGASGSGTVCLNGAAARLAAVGDKIIVISYVHMADEELVGFSPTLVFLDARNRIQRIAAEDAHAAASPASINPSTRTPTLAGALAQGVAMASRGRPERGEAESKGDVVEFRACPGGSTTSSNNAA